MNANSSSKFKRTVPRQHRENYLEDGVDHINVGYGAVSRLGQMLEMDANIGFVHPVFGKFSTLKGFWYYILCGRLKDDKFKYLQGRRLYGLFKKIVNSNRKGHLPPIRNFKAIILEAAYMKIMQNQELHALVFDNVLEIDCYRTLKSGIREDFSHSRWWVAGLRTLFYAVQTSTEPDLSYLMDDQNMNDIYIDVLPHYLVHAMSASDYQEEIKLLEKTLSNDHAEEHLPSVETSIVDLNASPSDQGSDAEEEPVSPMNDPNDSE